MGQLLIRLAAFLADGFPDSIFIVTFLIYFFTCRVTFPIFFFVLPLRFARAAGDLD